MEKEIIKTEKVRKIIIEYFALDDNGTITIQTRKFTKEDRADFFAKTLFERGVKNFHKKIFIDGSLEEREYSVLDIVREAIKNGESKVIIKHRIKPCDKETLKDMGLSILTINPEQFEISWLDVTKIKNI